MNSRQETKIDHLLVLIIILVSDLTFPTFVIDTNNNPKQLILYPFSFFFFGFLISQKSNLWKNKLTLKIIWPYLFFIGSLTVVFGTADSPKVQQFFGIFGRNLGFLNYISLAIIAISICIFASSNFSATLLRAMKINLYLVLAYAFAQLAGIDFAKRKEAIKLGSFFGNTDFLSAYLGLSIILLVGLMIIEKVNLYRNLILILLSLFIIVQTKAIQGFALILIGLILFSIYFINDYGKNRIIKFSYYSSLVIFSFYLAIGSLGHGFFGKYLYKQSVAARGDYWRTGIDMFFQSPIYGMGLDSYFENFTINRDLKTFNRNTGEIADNAHNIFIQFASTGGLLLVSSYLMIIGMALFSYFRFKRNHKESTFSKIDLIFVLYVGFLAQQFISIDHVGLSIWGWAFSSTLILINNNIQTKAANFKNYVMGILLVLIGFVIGILPIVRDAGFNFGIKSSNFEQLKSNSISWPLNARRLEFMTMAAVRSNDPLNALNFARLLTQDFPKNQLGWEVILNNPNSDSNEKALAEKYLKNLNPFKY